MKFKKRDLLDVLSDDHDVLVKVRDEQVGHGRWSSYHDLVFSLAEKYYQVHYSRGLTEQQDERPFEHEPDEIECTPVKQEIVSVVTYVAIE